MAISLGNPLEVWQRTLIDQLWDQGWELSRIEPPPPIADWHTSGMAPEIAAITIMQQYNKPPRKTRKATARGKGTKPLSPPTRSNPNCHYVLEKDRTGITTYYITRTEWTQDLAAAKFFNNPIAARTEAHLLPNGYEEGIGVRTINLIPDSIEIAQPTTP